MTTKLKYALYASAAFSAALSCSPAAAQAVAQTSPAPNPPAAPSGATGAQQTLATPRRPAADTSSAQEVIVTARRVEERLQDVPISITVFSQQQLSSHNIVTAGDLAVYTPSLTTDSIFGPENTSFAIRGFTREIGTTPSVAVYFAEVAAPRAGGSATTAGEGAGPGNLFDLQNVQVLKGPQGTLFGRNTTGGAVLLVPQKPTTKLEGYLEGTAGDYSQERLQGALNVPLNDKVRLRVGFDRNTRDGYLNNTSGIGPSHFDDVAKQHQELYDSFL